MKLNLRTKLIGSFIIILLLMAVVGLVGVYTSRRIENHLEDIVEQDVRPANILGVVARRVGFVRSNSLLHLFTKSVKDMNRYESEIADWADKINTNLDSLESIEDQTSLDKLAEFRVDWDTYLRIWNEQVIPLSRANRDEGAFALARKGGAAGMAAQEAMYKLDELHNAIIARADNSLVLAEQHFRNIQIILLAIILLAIILGLAFGIIQSSHIAGAVNTVSEAAQLVAAGDLDHRVKVKTGDEIESMADFFNAMTGNLKKMVEELRHEITERHRAEQELRQSEQWLSTTLRSIGDAVIATDAKGLVILMNPVAEDLTGWDEVEAAGKPLEDVFHIINEQTGKRAEDPATKVLREGVVVGLANHTVLIAKDGTKCPIADSGAPIGDEQGNIIGTVMVFRDITESKQAEEMLRESEEKFRIFAEQSPNMIFVNSKGRVVYVNKKSEGIMGYTKEEFYSPDFDVLSLIAPESIEIVKSGFGKHMKGEEVKPYEYTLITREGTRIEAINATGLIRYKGEPATLGITTDISELKQAEEELRKHRDHLEELVKERTQALRESEAMYSVLFDTAKDAIFMSDETGKLVDVNQMACESLGYSKEELLKLSNKEIDADPRGYEAFLRLRNGAEEQIAFEVNQRKKDGSLLPVEITGSFFSSGGQRSALAIARDITERKRAEKALREREHDLYERVKELDCFYGISCLVEKPGVSLEEILRSAVDLIPIAFQYPGITCARIILESQEFKTENFGETAWKLSSDLLVRGERIGSLEVCLLEEKPEEDEGPFLKDERSLINAVAEQLGRIIDHKRAEEELRKHRDRLEELVGERTDELRRSNEELQEEITERVRGEEALRKSEEKLSSFMNSAPDAFVLYDSELNLIRINKSGERMLGLGKQDIGRNMLEISPGLEGTDRYDKYLEVSKTGKPFSITDLVPHPKFGDLHLTVSAFKVGESLGLVVSDITELKRMEERLVRKEKLAVLGQLSGGVGHELRNPLGVISNAVYFLQMTLSDADETTSEYLGIISSEVRTAERIVSDLLDFSRVKSLEREETALSDLIDQTLEKQPPPESVKVTTEIPSELPPVFVDSRQIVQVLLNLVVNGYQAMPEGGELKITTRAEKSRVNLYITDTGCGISKENLKKIFEPLFTTRARGIGLGLAVSKNLMEANGGSLVVESEERKGTTFTVILPIKEAVS